VVFYLAKKDYFWLALIILLVSNTGSLFVVDNKLFTKGLPLYSFAGISLQYIDVFSMVAFIKAMQHSIRHTIFLKKELILLAGYFAFMIMYSFGLGMDKSGLITVAQVLVGFTFFYSFPKLINKASDFNKFIALIIPFVVIEFANVLFQFYYQQTFAGLLNNISILPSSEESFRPDIFSLADYFGICFAMYFLSRSDKNNGFFYLIILLSFVTMFLTATRSRIVVYIIMLILYFVVLQKFNIQKIFSFALLFLVLFFISNRIINFHQWIDNSLKRISTLELLVKGDVTAGGTLQRIDVRLPRVLKGIKANPVFGWGFSSAGSKYIDHHVGNFSLIAQVGIVGFILFMNFVINFFKKIHSWHKYFSRRNPFRKVLEVFMLLFISSLILQFSSYCFYDYLLSGVTLYWVIFILKGIELNIIEGADYQKKLLTD